MTKVDLSPTRVTFPAGVTDARAQIVLAVDAPDGAVVVVDETPFHPVDHTWPDQPGDTGTIAQAGESARVIDTAMAAVSDDGTFAIGPAIPVKRGTEGWIWLVAHRLDTPQVPSWMAAGAEVRLRVDREARHALSRGHSACHLAALALNAALADLWRKETGADSLGQPNFDARANETSQIVPHGSVDTYRLGKSLRKAGFDTEALAANLADIEVQVNAQLAQWTAGASRIDTDGDTIVDRRRWVAELPGGTADILCGGTHVAHLSEIAPVTITLTLPDPQQLVMTTTAAVR